MKVMEMELKKLTEAEKRDILGKSGSVDQLSKYLDLTKEDISDGLLIVDAATGRKLVYIGEMQGYDTDAVFGYLGTLRITPNARLGKGVQSNHIQIGFVPRNAIRGDYCAATTSFSSEDLQVFGHYMALYGESKYRDVMPEMYADHVKEMEKLKDSTMRISESSLFTSAVINRSNQIQYHYDRGNTQEGATLMCYITRGVEHGELLLPELDLAVNIRDNVFILMEGHRMIHGVAAMQRTTPSAERYSVVYYSKRDLFRCQPSIDEEADRAGGKYTLNFVEKLEKVEQYKKFAETQRAKIRARYADKLDDHFEENTKL